MYSQMFELSADGRSDKDEVRQENHRLSFVDKCYSDEHQIEEEEDRERGIEKSIQLNEIFV